MAAALPRAAPILPDDWRVEEAIGSAAGLAVLASVAIVA
jgi:hypothetical protein